MSAGGGRAPLAGRHIVVTRPAAQAGTLADLITARGGHPIVFPVLEIADVEDAAALNALVDRLDKFDLAIFVSPNAVDHAMRAVAARRTWPAALAAATVGGASERALRRHGIAEVIAPGERFDSEALLELLPAARVAGRRVVIFRGDGGRELLADTLAERGATVEYVACYRRRRPDADARPLLDAWSRDALDAVTVSSSEGLANFLAMIGAAGQARLARTPVFAPHARIAAAARSLGLEKVVETAPADEGIVAGLETFFARVSAS